MFGLTRQAFTSSNSCRRLIAHLIAYQGQWPLAEKHYFAQQMQVRSDFITPQEEQSLLQEIEPLLKRLPYESTHWDDAIHDFRELEHLNWSPANCSTLDRIRCQVFQGLAMAHVHVLDLKEQGVIKPHVDSTRFCGNIIAGLSLLSDCVMRLAPTTTTTKKYQAEVLLPRRSLYIMSDLVRYNFTHEILGNQMSKFQDQAVTKTRRVSIICRNEP